jgi:hypothetical protein
MTWQKACLIHQPLKILKPFPKNVLLLSDEGSVNVYMRPLNPLNYSYGSVHKTSFDSIDQRHTAALGTIIDNLGFLSVASEPKPYSCPHAYFNV